MVHSNKNTTSTHPTNPETVVQRLQNLEHSLFKLAGKSSAVQNIIRLRAQSPFPTSTHNPVSPFTHDTTRKKNEQMNEQNTKLTTGTAPRLQTTTTPA